MSWIRKSQTRKPHDTKGQMSRKRLNRKERRQADMRKVNKEEGARCEHFGLSNTQKTQIQILKYTNTADLRKVNKEGARCEHFDATSLHRPTHVRIKIQTRSPSPRYHHSCHFHRNKTHREPVKKFQLNLGKCLYN